MQQDPQKNIEAIIEQVHAIVERKKQLHSLTHIYQTHVLPFLSARKRNKPLLICLPACGEYVGAIDALACAIVFTPANIHAFDKYIDMHTKEVFENLFKQISHVDATAHFAEGDVYRNADFFWKNNKNDITIIRNICPELHNQHVFANLIETTTNGGLVVITALSIKEAAEIHQTIKKQKQLSLLRKSLVNVEGFLMNDQYIFVCRVIARKRNA